MLYTIEQLEKENWGEPESAGWPLVERCLKLRRKPINRFTPDDLRLMIGQDIGTRFLLPFALDLLERNPFAAGGCYPGDLLVTLLRLPGEYWEKSRELDRTVRVAHAGLAVLEERNEEGMFDRKLGSMLRSFIWQHGKAATRLSLSAYHELL